MSPFLRMIGTLLLLFSHSSLAADSCAPLRRGQGIPVFEQGPTNVCYAFAATTLIDVWRQTHGKTVPPHSSPAEAALRFAASQPGRTKWRQAQGGDPEGALELLLSEGSCPHVSRFDYRNELTGKRWAQWSRIATAREDFQEQVQREKDGKGSSGFFTKDTPAQRKAEIVRDVTCEVEGEAAPAGRMEELKGPITRALLADTELKSLRQIYALGCRQSGNLAVPRARLHKRMVSGWLTHSDSMTMFRKALQEAFAAGEGSVPAITYCSKVLLYRGVREAVIEQGYEPTCKSGTGHASAVLGRRRNEKGQCEYLIHNSWGASCDAYPWPCENGEVWVPEEELLPNLVGVSWLQES